MEAVGKVVNGKFVPFGNTGNADRTILQRIQNLETGKLDKIGNASQTTVTFEQAAQLANVNSGDSMSVALGKLSKLYAELESGQLGNAFSGDIAEGRALISDASGKISASEITSTELGALDGISGNIQEKLTELNGNLENIFQVRQDLVSVNITTAFLPDGFYWCNNSCTGTPKDNTHGYLLIFQSAKIFIEYLTNRIYCGMTVNNIWSGWTSCVLTSDLEKYFPSNKPYPYIGNGAGSPGGSKNVVLDYSPTNNKIAVYYEGTNVGYVAISG